MKRLVTLWLLLALCLTAALALGETAQPCYWQLTDVSVTQKALDALGPAAVSTNAEALADLKPIDMIEALSQPHTFSVDVTRAASGSNAHADYALSGMPALVPGAGSARLSLTSATVNPTSSFYVYASVYASKARVLRVRSTGAWVFRIPFPRTAIAGATRTVKLDAKELQGYADVCVSYTYTAMPGKMLVEASGDTVLYDPLGNEIDRIPRKVSEVLPVFASPSGSEGDILFSAEAQGDGSLLVRFLPDSGLTLDEMISLIRTATEAAKADAASGASIVSALTADKRSDALPRARHEPLRRRAVAAHQCGLRPGGQRRLASGGGGRGRNLARRARHARTAGHDLQPAPADACRRQHPDPDPNARLSLRGGQGIAERAGHRALRRQRR